MKLAVTHLTRMSRGFVCVAGVDVENGQSVRPVLPGARLRDQICARRGGPFDMATVVDLGVVRPVPSPPEVEDCEFTPWQARLAQSIEPMLFWEMLCHLAKTRLSEIFGPALRRAGRNSAVVTAGAGYASLGHLAPTGPLQLRVDERPNRNPQIRLHFSDSHIELDLSVTDLRLWSDDHQTPRQDTLQDVSRRLASGVPCLLSVGLTRPWGPNDDDEPVHWLQVNNLHLSDDPTWRLRDEKGAALRQSMPSAEGSADGRLDGDLDDLPF